MDLLYVTTILLLVEPILALLILLMVYVFKTRNFRKATADCDVPSQWYAFILLLASLVMLSLGFVGLFTVLVVTAVALEAVWLL